VRLSEFRRAMAEEFGDAYAGVLMRDHWLAPLGGTANEAIARVCGEAGWPVPASVQIHQTAAR